MSIGNKIRNIVVLEIGKWIGSIFLLVTSIIGNYVYHDCNIFIKNVIIFVIVSISICILLTTQLGKSSIILGKEAYIELRKIIWPTYQDSLNTTLIVIVVTVIISLILWGFDTILVHVISFGLRL